MSAHKVLVVDPDPDNRKSLATMLEQDALTPVPTAPADALAALSREEPSVALLRDGQGEASLGLIEAMRRATDLPIIVLTEDASEAFVTRAFDAGADDCLPGTVRAAELLARIRGQLRMRRALEELARKERDAHVMLELTQALASSLDFREILYTVVRRIAEVVDVARASIVLAPEQDEGDVGYVVVASDDEQLANLQLDLAKYPEIRQVLRTRQPLSIGDVATHPLLDGVRSDIEQVGSIHLFPIVWEEQAIGVLFLRAGEQRGVLQEREVRLCQIITNATAVALRNARVMQSLKDHTQQITFARFEAERRLRSLKRYADLFASAAEGIAVIDRDACLLFANPRAYEIVGYGEEELRGKRILDLVPPPEQRRARAMWAGFSEGEFPRAVDLRMHRKDGAERILTCSFAALLDGEGAVLLSFQDVTEQRATEAELKKTKEFLESLIHASVDGIVAADMRGNIILFNEGAQRIYGYEPSQVVGKQNVKDLYPDDGARRVMTMLRSDDHGGPGRLEPIGMHVLDAHGVEVPVTLSAALITDGGIPVATFGIFTDMRERMIIEERLAQAQQKLEVTEKQALIAELAGTAAHELNQPLTSVMAYAELLRRKLGGATAEHRAADIIVQETERMADIVRKIGKMTKYETKSYVGGQRILDLDKASAPSKPPTGE